MRKFIIPIILGILLVTVSSVNAFLFRNPLIDKPAPDFSLVGTSSDRVYFDSMRQEGKRTVLFFWATWCPHCVSTMHQIEEEIDKLNRQNAHIVIINVGESRQEVSHFLKSNGINLNVYLDETEEVSASYDVQGLPTFVFIDEQGVIRDIAHSIPSNLNNVF